MFSTRFTIAVLVIFLINYYARIFHIEPYPTLLLPDGPSSIKKDENNNVIIASKVLCAMDSANKWVNVDLDKLAQKMPVPSLYLSVVNFGFYDYQPRSDKLKNMLNIGKSETQKQEEYIHFQSWLRNKLEKQGLKSDSVKIKSIVRTFSLETHHLIHEKTNHESHYKLR